MAIKFRPSSKIVVKLNFADGVTEDDINFVPQASGIYVAFVCKASTEEDSFDCTRIAYIGKAEGSNNLRKRIQEHISNDHDSWAKSCELSDGEFFMYTYAVFDDSRLADVESALIFRNQPIVNKEHKDKYNGQSYILWISCDGNTGLLKKQISVMKIIE